MKNQTFSHHLPHILCTIVLVAALAMGSLSPARATVPYTVIGWGSNFSGETTIPSGLTDVVAIDGGANHSLALKSDGTVVAWGDNTYGQIDVPPGLSNVVAIAAGVYYNLALKSDGTVVAWGDNRWH